MDDIMSGTDVDFMAKCNRPYIPPKKPKRIIIDKKVKPKFPPISYRYELSTYCECGSSLRKYHSLWSRIFSRSKKCINPNCDQYYKGFPSEDITEESAIYINGKIIYQWRFK